MAERTHAEIAQWIVEATPDAVIYAGRDGKISLWNHGAETMFGYTAAEAIGQSLDLIIPERLRLRHWDGWNRVMETGQSRYGAGDMLAVPGIRKDGSRMSLEFTISMLLGDDGKPEGVAAVLRDVSTRFEQDRALHAQIKELQAQLAATGSAPATT